MINRKKHRVPDKTIAVVYSDFTPGVNFDSITEHIKKPSNKRDWFDSWFYNCLPLTIGNQYGFMVTSSFGFNVVWNGGNSKDDMNVTVITEGIDPKYPTPLMVTHFGFGVLTIEVPYIFRTPPGVNLMTINPPNYIIKNATVMTGVIESDNIRVPFTFNLRIQEPNVLTSFPAGTPLAGFIPIQRGFADKFELKDGEKVFGEKVFNEEVEMLHNHEIKRMMIRETNPERPIDRDYFHGQDLMGNKFPEHQVPNGEIIKRGISD
jgi:hypothetical protein